MSVPIYPVPSSSWYGRLISSTRPQTLGMIGLEHPLSRRPKCRATLGTLEAAVNPATSERQRRVSLAITKRPSECFQSSRDLPDQTGHIPAPLRLLLKLAALQKCRGSNRPVAALPILPVSLTPQRPIARYAVWILKDEPRLGH
jgi:hypothetical protein